MNAVLITPPSRPLRGKARPPGSKSITNRALLLAALARSAAGPARSRLTGALKSEDTARMSLALKAMGVSVAAPDETSFEVVSAGPLCAPAGPLNLGNAGTAVRFLTAAAMLVDGPVVLDGDRHMRKRPIAPLVQALKALGVEVTAPTGCPPVTVRGRGGFDGGRVVIDAGLSSQYVSALLMVAPCARGPMEVALEGDDMGAKGYVALTLAAMRAFGAKVEASERGAWRVEPTGYRPFDLAIEPDASAATYLWAAERITGGAIDIGLAPEDFSQPDADAYALIARFPGLPAVIDGSQIQDAVPTLAVLAAFNATPVRFTGVANLRVKECDRLYAIRSELCRIQPGLAREEGDELVVAGDPGLAGQTRPTRIQTYNDHRIAMSFALAGLMINGLTIEDPSCVAKTWPDYWRTLQSLGVALTFL